MFFGCNERGLASKRSGGTGEKPITVSSNKIAAEKISIGAGLRTVQRTYFRTSSKSQSCCCTGILPLGPVGVSPARIDLARSTGAEFPYPAGKMPAAPTDEMSVLR